MEQPAPPSTGKILASVLLVGLGLVGLAMSLCGGFFAGLGTIEFVSGKPNSEARAWSGVFLGMGSLSLVLGLLVIFLTVVAWKRIRRPTP